ncbi:hypothetical protein GCM10010129_09610 [Streptomyces fumigatiscleroticus]|nr:hypothetical protein GCM10010129_09610 [Streptomyces fumigatiscleroticus]
MTATAPAPEDPPKTPPDNPPDNSPETSPKTSPDNPPDNPPETSPKTSPETSPKTSPDNPPETASKNPPKTPPKDPSLRRSLALWKAFRHEQDDPGTCYALLARDAAGQVERYGGPVAGRVVVDVGGGSGHCTAEFRRRGARAYLFEPDVRELGGRPPAGAVLADGCRLPLADGAADVAFSSNVLEHVADPRAFLGELVRVTRPGGLIYVSFTNWLSPWGGHEWAPWHYFGAERARARHQRRTGRPAKHTLGHNLFRVHIGATLRQVRARDDVRVVSARSRYWPFLAETVVRAPGIREVATWNLLLVLRRCPP